MGRSPSKPQLKYAELPIGNITCYGNNPRVTRNPEYERLKNSLSKNGIEAPLVVTREPGAKHYTLHAGGNTRLNIAQSLHDAGDASFATVPCIVKEWTNELNVLVSHLRENDMRGNLIFIERAIGVMEFAKLASPPDSDLLSQREIARQLNEHGYALSQPVISAMDYAVNRLYGLLPTALEHGMGKRQVAAIRSLEHTAVKVWDRQCVDEAGQFTELFGDIVKNCDGQVFELEELTDRVAHEIAIAAELDINAVRLMLEAERAGEPIELERLEPVTPADMRKVENPVEKRPFNLERELQKLRTAHIEGCVELADSFELSEYVTVTIDERFGYFMCELPKRNAGRPQTAVWKLLATACDQVRASKRILRKLLEPGSRYLKALETNRPIEVLTDQSPLDLVTCGDRLLRTFDDSDWDLAIKLLSSYRQLRKLSDEHAVNLWSV